MKVSVIIPNYNHARFLNQRIDSVLNQTFKYFEIIILDDYSIDNSKEIIEPYRINDKVTHIEYNPENSGSTFHQWEKGLSISQGEYIWIAESDDFCDADFLEKTVTALQKNENAVLAYTNTIRVDEAGKVIGDLSFWYDDLSKTKWKKTHIASGNEEIKKYLSVKNTIPNASAVVFRRSALKVFDDKLLIFKVCGDWFFWIQLIKNRKLVYVYDTNNYFRTHTENVRTSKGNAVLMEREINCIRQNIVAEELLTENELSGYLKNYNKLSVFARTNQKIIQIRKSIKRRIKA